MTPEQLFPKMEGMIGHMIGSADGGSIQGNSIVTEWVKLVKQMLGGPSFRYLTDLQFHLTDNIVDVGVAVDAEATHLIAALVEVYLELGTDTSARFGYSDADADTVDNAAALAEDVVTVFPVNDLATTGVSEFYPLIFMAGASGIEAAPGTYGTTGINLTTGLTAWCDGADGNPPAASTVRAWTLYRD